LTRSLTRETWIGIAVTSLAVGAMAVDHLMGDDPPILEDPLTFAISTTLCVALALVLFARLVPRVKVAPDAGERAAKWALALSALGLVGGPLLFWLGLPFVLAGGGLALGLLGRGSDRRRLALAAVAVGSFVIALGAVGYGIQFVEKLR
jgi:drug/metabolite transporter (DMT)-like permease